MSEPTIGINAFSRRHTPESRFSHFNGSNEELVALVRSGFLNATPGNREGVLLVPVYPTHFFSGVTEVNEQTDLKAEFTARREGEERYVHVSAAEATKAPAKSAVIVIYSRGVLAEDGDNSTDCDWEIISINASALEVPEPPTPMAMARNLLHKAGGTQTEYSAEDFAKAILFWSKHVMVSGE